MQAVRLGPPRRQAQGVEQAVFFSPMQAPGLALSFRPSSALNSEFLALDSVRLALDSVRLAVDSVRLAVDSVFSFAFWGNSEDLRRTERRRFHASFTEALIFLIAY